MADRILSTRAIAMTIVVLLIVAVGAHQLRRAFIRSFFGDGPSGPAPALTNEAEDPGRGLEPSQRVRVVLFDGLRADLADDLPAFREACAEGMALTVDVGFPTVSLPVQHVLWTGRTQQQSGVLYRIPKLDVPPRESIPQEVESTAIAESHPDIVESFGFTHVTIDEDHFGETAVAAVAGSSPLVFVHMLRIDDAGHRYGADSTQYRDAATSADDVLARLRAADTGALWFVLADHGHRAQGGHAGPEPEIRLVRACITGDLHERWERAAGGRAIHLVDLSRAVSDSLGLSPRGPGRALAVALQHPEPDATLPRPPWYRVALALGVLLATIVGIGGAGRAPPPLWLPVAYLGVVVFWGWPTLSNPVIYPPHGVGMVQAAVPAAAVFAISCWWGRARLVATLLVQLLPCVSLALACWVLAGSGPWAGPPLMPVWTAHTSLLLAMTYAMSLFAVPVTLVAGASRAPE